jgi:DNA repair and recombination RAD54-like protein
MLKQLVKWLGEGAVNPLAIDGKVTGSELILMVRQWCANKGKGVVTPGTSPSLLNESLC